MSSKIDRVFNDIDKLSQKIPLPQNKIRTLEFEPLQSSFGCKAEASEKSWEKIFSR